MYDVGVNGYISVSIFTSSSRPEEPVPNSEHRELNLIVRVGRPLGHRYVELLQITSADRTMISNKVNYRIVVTLAAIFSLNVNQSKNLNEYLNSVFC